MWRELDRHYSLDELLDDPVARTLMAYDGVTPDEVRRLIDETRARLGYRGSRPAGPE